VIQFVCCLIAAWSVLVMGATLIQFQQCVGSTKLPGVNVIHQ